MRLSEWITQITKITHFLYWDRLGLVRLGSWGSLVGFERSIVRHKSHYSNVTTLNTQPLNWDRSGSVIRDIIVNYRYLTNYSDYIVYRVENSGNMEGEW